MRRRKLTSCLIPVVACLGCSQADGKPATPPPASPSPRAPMTAHNPDKSAPPPAASAQPADVLRIQVERSHNGHTAQGTVLLHRSAAPDAGESPHTKLAGTRAWLALGEQRLAAGDAPAAVACAQAGIQELGKRYAAPTVVDDTGMKIRAAEEQLQKGHTQDAAAVMLRMLATRTKLYAKLHAGAIAE